MDPKKPLVPRIVKGWFNLIDPLDQILWEQDPEDEVWSLSTPSVYPVRTHKTHRLPVQQGYPFVILLREFRGIGSG